MGVLWDIGSGIIRSIKSLNRRLNQRSPNRSLKLRMICGIMKTQKNTEVKNMFHTNLKTRRLFCNLSQQQVADFLNVTPQSISKWEKGAALPSIEYLPKLAEILECDVNRFFVQNEEKNEALTVLSKFFNVMMMAFEGGENIRIAVDFTKENPSVYEIFENFNDNLRLHQTISARTIQEMFSCSEKEASDLIQQMIDHEMVKQLEGANRYLVEEPTGNGFLVLLELFKSIIELENKKQ